jgi:translation initiation factor IF-2
LEKVRVYELAKELNTTSKRLMEKLAEIDVVVKNHMSLLEDDELSALYKHIGVIKREDKKTESEEKKAPPAATPQQKPEPRKDTKSAPRIIRTTEIIINSKNEPNTAPSRNDFQRGDVRGPRNDSRRDYIRSSDDNSGLRAGFVRDSRPDYLKEAGRLQDRRNNQEAASRENIKPSGHQAAKTQAVKPDTPALHKEKDNKVEINNDAAVQEAVKDRVNLLLRKKLQPQKKKIR